jgi:hypothetical protein
MIAETVTILDVFGESVDLDKGYVKNKSVNINHINQSISQSLTQSLYRGILP